MHAALLSVLAAFASAQTPALVQLAGGTAPAAATPAADPYRAHAGVLALIAPTMRGAESFRAQGLDEETTTLAGKDSKGRACSVELKRRAPDVALGLPEYGLAAGARIFELSVSAAGRYEGSAVFRPAPLRTRDGAPVSDFLSRPWSTVVEGARVVHSEIDGYGMFGRTTTLEFAGGLLTNVRQTTTRRGVAVDAFDCLGLGPAAR